MELASGQVEIPVLYCGKLYRNKKVKSWKDGKVVCNTATRKAVLLDDKGKIVDNTFVKASEIHRIQSDYEFDFDSHICERDSENASSNFTSQTHNLFTKINDANTYSSSMPRPISLTPATLPRKFATFRAPKLKKTKPAYKNEYDDILVKSLFKKREDCPIDPPKKSTDVLGTNEHSENNPGSTQATSSEVMHQNIFKEENETYSTTPNVSKWPEFVSEESDVESSSSSDAVTANLNPNKSNYINSSNDSNYSHYKKCRKKKIASLLNNNTNEKDSLLPTPKRKKDCQKNLQPYGLQPPVKRESTTNRTYLNTSQILNLLE